MFKYKFKDFFKTESDVIYNDEYVSNNQFLIKISSLKRYQLNYLNKFCKDNNKIKHISKLAESIKNSNIVAEFVPQYVIINNNMTMLYDKNNNVIIQEKYYNFITSLHCKIVITNFEYHLAIYNKDNIFQGILCRITNDNKNSEGEIIKYNEYLKILKEELRIEKERKNRLKKCLYLKNNKAVIRNKELFNVEGYDNLYIEKIDNNNFLYVDLNIVYFRISAIGSDYCTDSYTQALLERVKHYNLDNVIANIYNLKNNNKFVNIAEIKLLELSGASKQVINEFKKYRLDFYKKAEQERELEKIKEEQEKQKYITDKNNELDKIVRQAEQDILNKNSIENKYVTICDSNKSEYDTSLILYLMKKHNIKIPIKTQGWIKKALAKVYYDQEDNCYSYYYYNDSNNSTVFQRYLNQLIEKVCAKA